MMPNIEITQVIYSGNRTFVATNPDDVLVVVQNILGSISAARAGSRRSSSTDPTPRLA